MPGFECHTRLWLREGGPLNLFVLRGPEAPDLQPSLAGSLSLGVTWCGGSGQGEVGYLQAVSVHQGPVGHEGTRRAVGDNAALVEQDGALA